MLQIFKDKYPLNFPYQPDSADELIKIKNIADEKAKFYVTKTFRELHCTIYG